MIDLSAETALTLAQAARTLPGGKVHVSTIHRWRLRGIRGVKLETMMRGGTRITTTEAIDRFFAATTAAVDGTPTTPRTPRQRARAIRDAEQALERAGI